MDTETVQARRFRVLPMVPTGGENGTDVSVLARQLAEAAEEAGVGHGIFIYDFGK